ncbi:HAD family hydrolase [Streptomyces sp. NPDC015131]|uniref:HAD family hydrolase n=1 Tax=Streptomyces sp. NPDC015131 TaxID=3364941 RepID=UPI0036F64C9A
MYDDRLHTDLGPTDGSSRPGDLIGAARCVLLGFDGPVCRPSGRAGAPAGELWPTPYADPLIRTLYAVGVRLAVVGDTSPPWAARYLAGRGLAGCFGPHVYAGVDEALASLGAAPETVLLIGARPAELAAAREAGVPFLGHGPDEARAELLRAAGARRVVPSLEPVLAAVRAAARHRARGGSPYAGPPAGPSAGPYAEERA